MFQLITNEREDFSIEDFFRVESTTFRIASIWDVAQSDAMTSMHAAPVKFEFFFNSWNREVFVT